MPDFDDRNSISKWIDEHISAELPTTNINSTEEDIKYEEMVKKFMIHTCSSAVNGCLDEYGKCSKHFTSNGINATTTFNENGFPQYKRRSEKDALVVPHNRNVLLSWDGHANVEFAGSTSIVMYLYKVYYI